MMYLRQRLGALPSSEVNSWVLARLVKKSKSDESRHTVDLKACISMEFRHWPWSIFQNRPPVCVAPSDYEMFGILK
jgi:hypothetical protein